MRRIEIIQNNRESIMKRVGLALLVSAVFGIVILCGNNIFAGSPSGKNKKVIVTAKSVAGPMNIIKAGQWTDTSKGTAANASIIIDLSEDKNSIAKITLSIDEIKYEIETTEWTRTGTMSETTLFLNGPFPLSKGSFQVMSESGKTSAKGGFISSKEAHGSAHLYTSVTVDGKRYDIDLGEWQWKAIAK
jgi:hypothetical protein